MHLLVAVVDAFCFLKKVTLLTTTICWSFARIPGDGMDILDPEGHEVGTEILRSAPFLAFDLVWVHVSRKCRNGFPTSI